jgi:hypothetical protein
VAPVASTEYPVPSTARRDVPLVRESGCAHRNHPPGVPATVRTARCAHQWAGGMQSAECRVQSFNCPVRKSKLERERVKIAEIGCTSAFSARIDSQPAGDRRNTRATIRIANELGHTGIIRTTAEQVNTSC